MPACSPTARTCADLLRAPSCPRAAPRTLRALALSVFATAAQVKAITDIVMAVYLENQMYLEQLEYMQVAACAGNPDADICSSFFAADLSTGVGGMTVQIAAEYLPTLDAMGALDDC
eukprot:COSAG06_NODE_33901_length_482_cov_1.610966_2_plen_116_part_01